MSSCGEALTQTKKKQARRNAGLVLIYTQVMHSIIVKIMTDLELLTLKSNGLPLQRQAISASHPFTHLKFADYILSGY